MQIHIQPDFDAMSAAAAADFLERLSGVAQPLVCLPSGKSPVGFLQYIRTHFQERGARPNWKFVGLDEWVGVGWDEKGSCREFFDHHLFRPLGIPDAQVHFFDGLATDLHAECVKAEEWVRTCGGIDVSVLGIGSNGHLGLNEPGANPALTTQVSALAASTVEAAKDYFDRPRPVSQGITLGLATLLQSSTVYLLASGKGKSAVLKKALEGPVGPEVPASFLQDHPDCRVFMDTEAAAMLTT
jgi:galactosamine-6-phosphate isomerase